MKNIVRTVVMQEFKILASLWHNDHWVFPGGHVENKENEIDAAWREIWEECNLVCDKSKLVRLFAFEIDADTLVTYYCYTKPLSQGQKKDLKPEYGSALQWMDSNEFVAQVPERFRKGVEQALLKSKEIYNQNI